jgi:PAS domain S-box-containing protein
MRKRVYIGLGAFLLAILTSLLIWQGSFDFGDYGPSGVQQTFLFWAISTLTFVLTITLGFMLFRTGVKLYIERQRNREGSRIRSKLIVGALALSFVPAIFLVLFDLALMNKNLRIWFNRPGEGIAFGLEEVRKAVNSEFQGKVTAQAHWIAALPETADIEETGVPNAKFYTDLCEKLEAASLQLRYESGRRIELCASPPAASGPEYTARVKLPSGAVLVQTSRMRTDLGQTARNIASSLADYAAVSAHRTQIRNLYFMYMILITIFVLFVATWIARILSDQISNPISALLRAAGEVRKGNLAYRLNIRAIDELATLVRGFNEMVQELEANSRELESRRRFTEAILESIPTGVISVAADGRIQRVNRALRNIFPDESVERATQLRDLFSPEDAAEVRYLMKRARRTGLASNQMELRGKDKIMHLSVTVSALEEKGNSGFVIVLEDTSEVLRAQKASAWQEVARRLAHEMKNPLTPIALSAERIARQIERGPLSEDAQRIVHSCSVIIAREVESVKLLVDEFSQFARFPTAQPVRCDLNEVVRTALGVFTGRLDNLNVKIVLAENLPLVNIDPEQFKRVVINLVDNAAEAMHDSLVRNLLVETALAGQETVELVVADTGHGISPEEKEKLFLPYFSTKSRGTGLGLAIVSRIVADHDGTIRVEANKPAGARFIVEIPAASAAEVEEEKVIESSA